MTLVKGACTAVNAQVPCMERAVHPGTPCNIRVSALHTYVPLSTAFASTAVALGSYYTAVGIMVQPLYETALKRWLLVVAALRLLAGSYSAIYLQY